MALHRALALDRSYSSFFAMMTTLFYADKSLDVIKCCVENDIKIIMDWFRANSLTLNVQKTKILTIYSQKGQKKPTSGNWNMLHKARCGNTIFGCNT